jgi:hypothetical protein
LCKRKFEGQIFIFFFFFFLFSFFFSLFLKKIDNKMLLN